MSTDQFNDESGAVLDQLSQFQIGARGLLSDHEIAILDSILETLNKDLGDDGNLPDAVRNDIRKNVEAIFRTQEKRG